MTVTENYTPYSYYPAADMLPEALPWSFETSDDIAVIDESYSPLVEGMDYEISGDGPSISGKIQTLRAFGDTYKITVLRSTARRQQLQLPASKAIPSRQYETELDRRARIEQEQDVIRDEIIKRTPLVPEGELAPAFASLVGIEDGDLFEFRDNKLQRFNHLPFAGKYFAGGVRGHMVPAGGTGGGDMSLRSDLVQPQGAKMSGFLPPSLSTSLRSVEDKLQEVLTLPDYGGIGDGLAHTVQEWIIPGSHGRYADLSALQVDYPHVTATTNCANWAALLKAVKVAQDNSLGYVMLGAGIFAFTQTVEFTGPGIAIIGVSHPNIQLGSIRTASTVRWLGGATHMWKNSTTSWDYFGFGIENGTVATDWLLLSPGSGRNTYTKLYAVAPNGTTRLGFTRSLIQPDGNRLGYGGMSDCIMNSIAPVIIDLQNAGTSNAVTTFYMRHNQFAASTQNMSALKITGETIEVLDITDNTTIMDGYECNILDTTHSAALRSVQTLNFQRNECDVDSTFPVDLSWRFLKLQNVTNATISNNQWYGGAALTSFVTLINSNVTGQSGNFYYSSPGYLYEPDATSTIAPGHNVRFAANTNGDYPPDWLGNIHSPPVSGATILDLSKVPGETKVVHLHPVGGTAYQIRATGIKPYWVGAGQMLLVAIINDSGGVIHAGSFRPDHFIMTGGANVAPADGHKRLYWFYFDGSYFIEISRSAADIPLAPTP